MQAVAKDWTYEPTEEEPTLAEIVDQLGGLILWEDSGAAWKWEPTLLEIVQSVGGYMVWSEIDYLPPTPPPGSVTAALAIYTANAAGSNPYAWEFMTFATKRPRYMATTTKARITQCRQ